MSDHNLIEAGGTRLEVKRWPGRALPILLLHEGLGSISMWRDFPAALAKATGHEVVAWSRRGYGASDPADAPRDNDYLHHEAAVVPAVMDALNIRRAHLLGHSDGASIALIVAAQAGPRVASLILEAPHVYVEKIALEGIEKAKALFHTTDFGARLGRHHRDGDLVFRRWHEIWLDPNFHDWSIEAILPRISAPALLIQGEGDEYGSMDQLDRIAAILPQSRRLELADCGHSPHREQPQAVLAAITEFLHDIEPRPTPIKSPA